MVNSNLALFALVVFLGATAISSAQEKKSLSRKAKPATATQTKPATATKTSAPKEAVPCDFGSAKGPAESTLDRLSENVQRSAQKTLEDIRFLREHGRNCIYDYRSLNETRMEPSEKKISGLNSRVRPIIDEYLSKSRKPVDVKNADISVGSQNVMIDYLEDLEKANEAAREKIQSQVIRPIFDTKFFDWLKADPNNQDRPRAEFMEKFKHACPEQIAKRYESTVDNYWKWRDALDALSAKYFQPQGQALLAHRLQLECRRNLSGKSN